MSLLTFFSEDSRLRRKLTAQMETYTEPSVSFFVLIGCAAVIAAAGLILDNAAIIIGAMVVAPLITPLFGLSLGLILFRWKQVWDSLVLLLGGTLLGIAASYLIAELVVLIEGIPIELTDEIFARTESHLLFFIVALMSGIAGAYSYAKPHLYGAIAGVAMSVALIPPLAVAGIGLAMQDWVLTQGSVYLYIINLAGILFGSILLFITLGFGGEEE